MQLNEAHSFFTPLGFMFSASRTELKNHFSSLIFMIETKDKLINRLCRCIVGLKSTGKTTLLRTCCAVASLLTTIAMPIYLDFHQGVFLPSVAATIACHLRDQQKTEIRPLIIGDEFQCLFLANEPQNSITARIVNEFYSAPDSGRLAFIAGSSAHLWDFCFRPSVLDPIKYAAYPRSSWNDTKYLHTPLLPLRKMNELQSFVLLILKSGYHVSSDAFKCLTGEGKEDMSDQVSLFFNRQLSIKFYSNSCNCLLSLQLSLK